jgi:hypothetical protein
MSMMGLDVVGVGASGAGGEDRELLGDDFLGEAGGVGDGAGPSTGEADVSPVDAHVVHEVDEAELVVDRGVEGGGALDAVAEGLVVEFEGAVGEGDALLDGVPVVDDVALVEVSHRGCSEKTESPPAGAGQEMGAGEGEGGSEGFDDHGDALAAADAGGAETVAGVATAQLMDEVSGDAVAGGSEGVAQGDGAAVDVGLVAVEAEGALDGNILGREGLVDLNEVHLLEGEASALEGFLGGVNGADAHDGGLNADVGPGDEAGEGSKLVAAGSVGRGDDDSGGAVRDARGVASGDDTVFGEDGGELGEGRSGGVGARVLVGGEGGGGAAAGGEFDGGELGGEAAFGVGGGPALLGEEGVSVHVSAGDVVLLREVFGGDSHRGLAVAVGEGGEEGVDEGGLLPEAQAIAGAPDRVRGLAHRLGAAGEDDVGLVEEDLLGGGDDGLEARAAEPVHSEGWTVDGEASAQADVASEIDRVNAGLLDVAEDDLIDVLGFDVRGVDGGLGGEDAEVSAEKPLREPLKVPKGVRRAERKTRSLRVMGGVLGRG